MTTQEEQTDEPVATIDCPFHMSYTFVAGTGHSVFLRGLAERKLLARACPSCREVYLPPPNFCSRCLTELGEPFELEGRGKIATFCIVSFPFPGQTIEPPYVVAHIQPHGAGTRLMHLIREIEPGEVEIDMEVEPVWVSEEELDTSLNSIRHFRPVAPGKEAADA